MIKLFLDNFKVLVMHPNQYGETEVLEMRIDLVLGAVPINKSETVETQIRMRIYELRRMNGWSKESKNLQ